MQMRIALIMGLMLPLAACSDFPSQGFVTRSLGGTVFDALPGTGGGQISQVYVVPEPVGGEPTRRPDPCIEAARSRADDVKAQGFDESLQLHVYEATLSDCRKWKNR